MPAPHYPIRTERLLLRPPEVGDAEAVTVYKSRPELTRFVPHGPLTVEQVRERHGRALQWLDEPGQMLNLLAFQAADGALVGDIVVFWHAGPHRAGEIGYIFDPAFSGRGYATEAARAGLALLFERLGLHRVVGRIDARNDASARVLQRLGMRREAHFVRNELMHGEWTDEVVYALLEDEWRAAATRRCR